MSCPVHTDNGLTEYCIPCDITMCQSCDHTGHAQHHVVDLSAYTDEKRREMSAHKARIKNELLPRLSEELQSSQKTLLDYKTAINNIVTKARGRAELMKQVIDLVFDAQVNEAQKICERDTEMLSFRENELRYQVEDLERIVGEESESAESDGDLNVIANERELRRKLVAYTISEKPCPRPPKFTTGVEDMIPDLSALLGKFEKFEGSGTNNCNNRKGAEVKVQIQNSFPCARQGHKVAKICQTSSNELVVAYSTQKNIDYFDRNFRKAKSRRISFEIQDVASNLAGELFLTANDSSEIFLLRARGNPVRLHDAAPYKVLGTCTLKDGNIATTLWKPEDGKLAVLNSDGKLIQMIANDDNGRVIFRKPYRICEGSSAALLVTDSAMKVVIGINSCKRRIFQYNGGPEMKNFLPTGVVCDVFGQVVVSNWKGNSVHLLSEEGEFLRFILSSKDSITYPLALSIDSTGKLLICNKEKVTVVKYIK